MRWFVSKGWHAYGGESMTQAARRWFQHGVARWVLLALIVYVALHVSVTHRFDPLDRAYQWVERKLGPEPYENPPAD